MKRAFCLLNHVLTEKQVAELKERFDAETIVYPQEELSQTWAQIPPIPEFDAETIGSAVRWLSSARKGDILLAQGEFGHTFMLVDWALKHGLVALHAVARRVSLELRVGEQVRKQNVFEHLCFRKYAYFSECFVNFSG